MRAAIATSFSAQLLERDGKREKESMEKRKVETKWVLWGHDLNSEGNLFSNLGEEPWGQFKTHTWFCHCLQHLSRSLGSTPGKSFCLLPSSSVPLLFFHPTTLFLHQKPVLFYPDPLQLFKGQKMGVLVAPHRKDYNISFLQRVHFFKLHFRPAYVLCVDVYMSVCLSVYLSISAI